MNSESGQRLSMDELKQLNAQQSEATQPPERIPQPPVQQQPLQPILIQCAMPEVLTQLEKQLHHLEEQSEWQTEYLYKLFETRNSHPTREQIAQLQKSLTQIETMLEQAGKQNEKRFSLPSIKLPRLRLPHLSPAMLLIPTLLVVLWAAWYSLGALWNAPRILSQ